MKYIYADKLIAEIERRIARLDKELIPAAEEDFVSSWASTAKNKRVALQSILSFIASLQQEQPEVDLGQFDKDVTKIWGRFAADPNDSIACLHIETFNEIARHFYGLRNRALEEAARHVYESWMGGTMDDVRRDMVTLGAVLNVRKEE
jgi:hypothetical protein